MKRRLKALSGAIVAAAAILGAGATVASAAPVWEVDQAVRPTVLPPGGTGTYEIIVRNIGDVASETNASITVTLPDGVTATSVGGVPWECPGFVEGSTVTCSLETGSWNMPIPPLTETEEQLSIAVKVDPGLSGPQLSTATVSGGGASGDSSSTFAVTVGDQLPGFGLENVRSSLTESDGSPAHQAGMHPNFTTRFAMNTQAGLDDAVYIAENLKDISVDLPKGLTGDPTAVPTCPAVLLSYAIPRCPPESQVGIANVFIEGNFGPKPVYNVEAPRGTPGRFAFNVVGVVSTLDPVVRSNGDYGITSRTRAVSQSLGFRSVRVTLWGVPADPSHDAQRGYLSGGGDAVNIEFGIPSSAPRLPFFTMPTECSGEALETRFRASSWGQPDLIDEASTNTYYNGEPVKIEGCNQLDFSPTIEARPTTNLADSPSGLDVKLTIPQSEDPDGLATAHLKDASVLLPEGMTVNAASADGLGACSPAQVGLTTAVGQARAQFDEAAVACPNSAKLGTVRVETPLLNQPLEGAIYLATPNENPFGSLLALYLVVQDPISGVTIKLAGHPVADPRSGQLRVDFENNPQLPFENLKVNLFSGPRAALKTPMSCARFTTTSTLVPWSSPEGPSASPGDSFDIIGGAGNSPCLKSDAEAPNRPTFNAGTTDPAAGAYTPFALKLVRADGTQAIKAIDTTLPKGLLGKLAGIPYCPDAALAAAASKTGKAEQASASCPALSRVGGVTVGAGAGSNPLYVEGNAYLAGPYKGAALSLAVITPAVAGPFDLGTVVIRNALNVDPETAKIHAVSDQIPTILQGIPLDIRSIALQMDRPQFILNPTSCEPMSVLGSATSVLGQTAALSNPFQVGGCNALGFKPKLAIDLSGATKRGKYPALRATLKARPGDTNIGKAVVTLPKSAFLAQNHIKTICTRVQFAANACPPGSVYGKAKAWSPLLDQPLSGPVYLRSSSNKLPDLVADLNGQIRIALVGRIDSIKTGGIRSSFESVPDAPVSKFVLEMAGGKKGLLQNSRNLCNSTNKATVQLDGQSGKTADSTPVVKADCKGKKAKKKHKKSASKGSRR